MLLTGLSAMFHKRKLLNDIAVRRAGEDRFFKVTAPIPLLERGDPVIMRHVTGQIRLARDLAGIKRLVIVTGANNRHNQIASHILRTAPDLECLDISTQRTDFLLPPFEDGRWVIIRCMDPRGDPPDDLSFAEWAKHQLHLSNTPYVLSFAAGGAETDSECLEAISRMIEYVDMQARIPGLLVTAHLQCARLYGIRKTDVPHLEQEHRICRDMRIFDEHVHTQFPHLELRRFIVDAEADRFTGFRTVPMPVPSTVAA